ncbi:MFS transporter [Vibrio sp. SS-MA-C1-2]|uniref:MFS transporter n=1 Tax=Vibrio sp. SS-MA-C1-2 TaxID=2908646 RepID=UPI001F213C01|nr:MFS transporter [Vibrio sp. SS-MA-C1-2]UJF17807.1 MFS transporter [Vibrio sp. SS-MA-C1-2]
MNKWTIEFVLYAVYMIFGAAWATTGSVMPEIMADFHVNVSDAALMSNVILWAKIVGSVCTAVLTAKLGTKKSYLLGCILIGISVFIPLTNNFELLLVIRFLGGLGGAICLVSLVPTVARFFNQKDASSLNSINCTSNIIGTIIALTLAGYLSTQLGGWKNLLALYGLLTLALGIIWLFAFKDNEQETTNKVKLSSEEKREVIKQAIFNRVVWGMIIQYIGAMIMMIFMFTFLPLYYAKYANLPQDSYAHLSGTFNQVGIMLGAFVGPIFKQKGFHYKGWLFKTSIFMAVTTFIMLFAKNDILILSCSFLTGLVFATWFAFIFSLPKECIKNADTKVITYTMSVFWFCTFLFATINSQLIAWSIDNSGSFTMGFSYVFALMVISPILAIIIFPKEK